MFIRNCLRKQLRKFCEYPPGFEPGHMQTTNYCWNTTLKNMQEAGTVPYKRYKASVRAIRPVSKRIVWTTVKNMQETGNGPFTKVLYYCSQKWPLLRREKLQVHLPLHVQHFRNKVNAAPINFFVKNGQPRPLFRLFLAFSNKQYYFYNKSMRKMSIQYTAPGFVPMTSQICDVTHFH